MKEVNALIVFAKNPIHGTVKTRLADQLGNEMAFSIYQHLLQHTLDTCKALKNTDVLVYFTEKEEPAIWDPKDTRIQHGQDLGERMRNAFLDSFQSGYMKVVGIGTDLPDLTVDILDNAFDMLDEHSCVLGPSADGGYYLIGMDHLIPDLFQNKEWSTSTVLDQTIHDLKRSGITYSLLNELNDIDTTEDLIRSSIYPVFNEKTDQK